MQIKPFILLLIGILISASMARAQELPDLKKIKLSKKIHYKDTEPLVLKVTQFIFATPIDPKNNSRRQAGQFLIKWMDGTPDYIFYLGEKETEAFSDTELMLIYMAGLTSYTLQHKEITDQKARAFGALQRVLPYLDEQQNKKAWPDKLLQMLKAYKKGELQRFLDENN